MPSVKDYVERIEGVCGAETDVIVTLRGEKKNTAIANIIKRSVVKKSVSDFMFEFEFQDVTFRLFSSGRAVFRGVKNRKELNRILAKLLLQQPAKKKEKEAPS
jgi:ribonuclease HIII